MGASKFCEKGAHNTFLRTILKDSVVFLFFDGNFPPKQPTVLSWGLSWRKKKKTTKSQSLLFECEGETFSTKNDSVFMFHLWESFENILKVKIYLYSKCGTLTPRIFVLKPKILKMKPFSAFKQQIWKFWKPIPHRIWLNNSTWNLNHLGNSW